MPVALVLLDPEVLIGALFAVLIVFAVVMLGIVLSNMLPKTHVLGLSWVVSNFKAGIGVITDALENKLVSAIGPAVAAIGVITHMFSVMYGALQHTLATVFNNFAILIDHWIPGIYNYLITSIENAYGKAIAYVHTVYAYLITSIENAYGKAIAYVHTVYAYLITSIENAYGKAIAYTHAVYAYLIGAVENAYGKAIAYAAAIYAKVETDIAHAYAAATAYAAAIAEHWAKEAVATVDAEAHAVTAAVWPGIVTDIQGLESVIGQDFADVRSAIGSIPHAIPTDLTGALAGVAALTGPLLRLAKNCTVPQCRNLGGLSHLLEDLFSAGTDAALLAMFAEIVKNPTGAAQQLDDTLSALAQDTMREAANLVGAA